MSQLSKRRWFEVQIFRKTCNEQPASPSAIVTRIGQIEVRAEGGGYNGRTVARSRCKRNQERDMKIRK